GWGRRTNRSRHERPCVSKSVRGLGRLHGGGSVNRNMTPTDAATHLRVQRFLIAESRALDDGDWDTWLALFSAEGIYWMPASPSQQDPLNHVSLIYDDAPLRDLRCRRYRDGGKAGALSLDPSPRSL